MEQLLVWGLIGYAISQFIPIIWEIIGEYMSNNYKKTKPFLGNASQIFHTPIKVI